MQNKLFFLFLFSCFPIFSVEDGFFQGDNFIIFLQIIVPIILLFFLIYIFVEATEKKEIISSKKESIFSPLEDEISSNSLYSSEFKNYLFPIVKELLNDLDFKYIKLYLYIGNQYKGIGIKKGSLIVKMENEDENINFGLETESILKRGYIALKDEVFYIPLVFENELISILCLEETSNEEIEKQWQQINFKSELFLEKSKYYQTVINKQTNFYNLFYFYTFIEHTKPEDLLLVLKITTQSESNTSEIGIWIADYLKNLFSQKIELFYIISQSTLAFKLPEAIWVDFTENLPELMKNLNGIYEQTSVNIGAAKPEITGELWYKKSKEALRQSIQKGKNHYTIL